MRLIPAAAVLASVFGGSLPAAAQDAGKWAPYQFAGNERFEYKTVMIEGEEKKESGYLLDLRKKGDDAFEVTVSTRNLVKKEEGAEIMVMNAGGMATAFLLINPVYMAFFQQLELKEGEKLSLFGAGLIKVGPKQTVGGRSGWVCKMYTPEDGKEVLTAEWTIDPALALPIRSLTYEDGKEKTRFELLSYKRD